jgi:hypothetical protein
MNGKSVVHVAPSTPSTYEREKELVLLLLKRIRLFLFRILVSLNFFARVTMHSIPSSFRCAYHGLLNVTEGQASFKFPFDTDQFTVQL